MRKAPCYALAKSAEETFRALKSGSCRKLYYHVSRLRDEVSKLKLKTEIIRVGDWYVNAV
jgi:hypothetical protein